MAKLRPSLPFHARYRESARLGAECAELIESIGDPKITIDLLCSPMYAKLQASELVEALRLAQRVIELAKAHPRKSEPIVGAPLALAKAGRGATRCFLGIAGWQDDFDNAIAMARMFDATAFAIAAWFKFGTITHGTLLPDSAALRDTVQAFAVRSAGDFTVEGDLVRLQQHMISVFT